MAWWKRRKTGEDGLNPDMPLIRLEGISKVFKGDADEETWALSDVTTDIGRGRIRLDLRAVGMRQVDVPVAAGHARHADAAAAIF